MSILQKNLPITIRLYLLPAVFFGALIGVNVYLYQDPDGTSLASFSNGTDQGLLEVSPDSLLSIEKVKSLALAEIPNVAITKIKLEQREAKPTYVVNLANSVQLVFDAQTGKKLAGGVGPVDDSEAVSLPSSTPSVDFDDARKIALANVPDSVISGIELKTTGTDTVVYSVHFVDGGSINIAAADGSVLPAANSASMPSTNEIPGNSEEQSSSEGTTDGTDTQQDADTSSADSDTNQSENDSTGGAVE